MTIKINIVYRCNSVKSDSIELLPHEDILMCALYAEYMARVSHGVPFRKASYFGDDASIRENYLTDWPEEDVTDFCWMLKSKGLLNASRGDNKANNVMLTSAGVLYMSKKYGRKEAILNRLKEIARIGINVASIILDISNKWPTV